MKNSSLFLILMLWFVCMSPSAIGQDDSRFTDSLLAAWQNPALADSSRQQAIDALLHHYFDFHLSKGWDSAIYYLKRTVETSKELGDDRARALACKFIAQGYGISDRTELALEYAEKELRIREKLEDQEGIAGAICTQGIIYNLAGQSDQAIECLERSLRIYQSIGGGAGVGGIYDNLGDIYYKQGDRLKGIRYSEKAVEMSMIPGEPEGPRRMNLSQRYAGIGDIQRAAEQSLAARAIFEKNGDQIGEIIALLSLANTYENAKEYEQSITYALEAFDLADEVNDTYLQAVSLSNAGLAHQGLGGYEKAIELYRESLDLLENDTWLNIKSHVLLNMTESYLESDNDVEAKKYLTEGYDLARVHGRPPDKIKSHLLRSRLSIIEGTWGDANTSALTAYEQAQQHGDPYLTAKALAQLVEINKRLGNTGEALRWYEAQMMLEDSTFNEENSRALLRQEYQYEYDKKALSDSLYNVAQLELKAQDIQRRTTINWLLGAITLIFAILGGLLFNRFRLTQRQKKTIEQDKLKLDAANADLNTAIGDLNAANEKLQELDAFKSRFFTNISHEFRTPLTVIGGMTDQIMAKPDQWAEKGGTLIKRNVRNLLSLINQILDLRKLESGGLSLSLVQADVVKYLRIETAAFESLAESKGVTMHFESKEERIMMDLDPEKLGQIQTNLVSNAIKFTPAGGQVQVQLAREAGGTLLVKVSDTGVGVPADKLPLIFDRFYQVDSSDTREGEGTGIGLSLTKELVSLMEGEIAVESEEGKGTTFFVRLPIRQEAPLTDTPIPSASLATSVLPLSADLPTPPSSPSKGEKHSLLIIEDNPDIVEYLYACLEGQYEVFSAPDGQAGIEAALEQVPDLIITDVMMPRKNGYEVCETLKLDERTSHIPIVMLTAKADHDSRMEGYKRGADAYLAKPFNEEELFIRLETLLELRRRLQRRYQQGQLPTEPAEDPQTRAEDEFITQVRACILAHLDDSSYRGEGLMKDLAISRTNLHRKLKALTGLSTSHFIRAVRIEAAKKLLAQPEHQVAEVAYATGFSDPNYFNRVFLEAQGCSPTEWRSQHGPSFLS